jgi:glycosyltransferase involved in cell wall biosynthesis
MVAAFEPRKDYKTLVEGAFYLLASNDNLKFVLVGNGSNYIELKNSVPTEFQDKIIFLGRRSDIESIVTSFDVGILLTNSKVHGEGVSNSIIEYMASGKPVIATHGGGTNEVVINNQNGYLINPHDSSQLVESILKLINNKELRTQFGASGYCLAQNIFDLKIMTRNYISVYHKLLQENKN